MKLKHLIFFFALAVSPSIFSQDSLSISVNDTIIDQVDSTTTYHQYVLKNPEIDTVHTKKIHIEVQDLNSNRLLSDYYIQLPEDQDTKYVIIDSTLHSVVGIYNVNTQIKVFYREENYQGVLSDLKEITPIYE